MSEYLGMAALAEIVGKGPACALVAARGGTRVYVPERPGEGHWLPALIGAAAAEALAAYVATGHGGGHIELPCGPAGRERTHRARRRAAIEGGRSETEIARELQINGRSVRRMRARMRSTDPRQGKLFQ